MLPILLFFAHSLQTPSDTLPPWKPGCFDIHHISTGRGNATYLVFPDGTTALLDAGDISDTHPRTTSSRNSVRKPNDTRTAAQWIIDYILDNAPEGREHMLDYALITHYHDDHFGEWDSLRPKSRHGDYVLTGMLEVGDSLRIRKMIDRGFDYPVDVMGDEFVSQNMLDEYHIVQTLDHYAKFIAWQAKQNRLVHETLSPGAQDQIVLENAATTYPSFTVRNISVNGHVWTGFADNDYYSLFRDGQYPGENPLSLCLKFSYGNFDYFTGGDISGVDEHGNTDPNSVESNIAPVVGPVDIATLNHHGNRDAANTFFVRTLRPRVWIGQTWSSDHPGHDVLRRITSRKLYPGDRDIFATDMLDANMQVIGDSVTRMYKALHGHIVVRVHPGGDQYDIYVLDDKTEERKVLGRFGPYLSR